MYSLIIEVGGGGSLLAPVQASDGIADMPRLHLRGGKGAAAPAAQSKQRGQQQKGAAHPLRFPADEGYPAPPFQNINPTGAPPATGLLFPQQPPPHMPTCKG